MKKLVLFIGIIAVAFGVLWMISRPEGERNVSPRMSMEKGSPVVVRAGAEKADVGEGNVTVSASWKELTSELRFEVALNTHSVSLDGFDPKTQITLERANDSVMRPRTIIPEGEGHHRTFTVSFPKQDGELRLVVSNLAGVKRRELVW